jgi:hypothetical protein
VQGVNLARAWGTATLVYTANRTFFAQDDCATG